MKVELQQWLVVGVLGIAGMWAQIPAPITALIILMFCVNLPLSLIAMLVQRKLCAVTFWKAGARKVSTLFLLAACHFVEPALGLTFHLETKVAIFFVMYEAIHILETAALAGVAVPPQFIKFLRISEELGITEHVTDKSDS